ncbi:MULTISPECIES: hypothetical protein [unclassified Bradyrhizobium]|uniref:hypothetical protein n=1 Tax=unclassified Bradyrhizobium TaxID=2631580 RepID=UPI002916EDB1|nr:MULTISPECIES: hypothetical protein [unclassified Bradyrhizobium]
MFESEYARSIYGGFDAVVGTYRKNQIQRELDAMGTFYTEKQIEEAIAALENNSPGIWERMKKMAALPPEPLTEEEELEQGAIVRVLTIVLPQVSFVAQAQDKNEARARLSIDLGNAVRAAIGPAKKNS